MTDVEDQLLGCAPRARLAQLLALAPVSGGVIAVSARDGAGTFRTATMPFGNRGPNGSPIDSSDFLEIGSISKTVTALAAARMAVEGRWSLDEHVRGVLPWLELPHGAGEPTLRHLLDHTAGWLSGSDAVPGDLSQALLLPETHAHASPGEWFHYSNIGYIVLGLALAARFGATLETAVRELVLDPLGLGTALADITGAERALLCPGTVALRDDAVWLPGSPLAQPTWVEPAGADGNVAADANSLARFGAALACPGGDEFSACAQWLPAAVDLLGTPSAPSGEDILTVGPHQQVLEARYGLGINVETTQTGRLLTHGGGMIGYGSFLVADPVAGAAVAVLLSCPGELPFAELLARETHANLTGYEAVSGGTQASVDPIATLLPPRRNFDPAPPARYASLAGTYRSYSPWFPHFEIGSVEGTLMLRAYSGVEAPTEDVELVELPGGEGTRFSIGTDPRLPETLEFSGFIGGTPWVVNRDGCRYSRVVDR